MVQYVLDCFSVVFLAAFVWFQVEGASFFFF